MSRHTKQSLFGKHSKAMHDKDRAIILILGVLRTPYIAQSDCWTDQSQTYLPSQFIVPSISSHSLASQAMTLPLRCDVDGILTTPNCPKKLYANITVT